MPDKLASDPSDPIEAVRLAARQRSLWTRKRDAAVLLARDEGHSLRAVAAAADVHHSTISTIEEQARATAEEAL